MNPTGARESTDMADAGEVISNSTKAVESNAGDEQNDVGILERHLALAYFLTSIDSLCESLVITGGCSAAAFNLPKKRFYGVLKASIDVKLS